MGCVSKECALCLNNPNKTCADGDNFDAAYADNQVLKTKCDAEVFVELVNRVTREPYQVPGVDVQVRVF